MLETRLRHDRDADERLDAHVVLVRMHGGGDVGRKRPWRRRPDDQVLTLATLDREAHV